MWRDGKEQNEEQNHPKKQDEKEKENPNRASKQKPKEEKTGVFVRG